MKTSLMIAPLVASRGGSALVYETYETRSDATAVAVLAVDSAMTWFNDYEYSDDAHLGCAILEEYGFEPNSEESSYGADYFIRDLMQKAGMKWDSE